LAKALSEGRVTVEQVEGLLGGDRQLLDRSERPAQTARVRPEQVQTSRQADAAAAQGRRRVPFGWGLVIGFGAGALTGLALCAGL
jgi:hypothetical protein